MLLAYALTGTGPRCFFAAVDVQAPICRIMMRPYKSPSFARHLNDFCSDKHGEVLHAEGEKHKVRFTTFLLPHRQAVARMAGAASRPRAYAKWSSDALERQLGGW